MRPSLRHIFAPVLSVLLTCLLLLSACSDDPILGPSDGSSEDGGSYSVIKRLAPTDTAEFRDTSATTRPLPSSENPERF